LEQVGNFSGTAGALHAVGSSDWPEEVQLGSLGGMAVNYTGAGGVPAGTIYAATDFGEVARVVRYNPDRTFSERWDFGGGAVGDPAANRCGPNGEPVEPVCTAQERENGSEKTDVDIDQTTGDVYVFFTHVRPGENLIHVYTPDGSELIAEFAPQAEPDSTIDETPSEIHEAPFYGGIAVNDQGDVYVLDYRNVENFRFRLMKFEPRSPGDYTRYVYAGQSHDLAVGNKIGESAPEYPAYPVTDAAGHIYVDSELRIRELNPDDPGAPPICTFAFPRGGIGALTVNPTSGEVFFFGMRDHKIHQLTSCNEATREFTEVATPGFSPARAVIYGLAFDPDRSFDPGRPSGILYAGAPGYEGGVTEPKAGLIESAIGYVFAPPPELPPAVSGTAISHVTTGTALVTAQVNPNSTATRYAFQFETQAQFEQAEGGRLFTEAMEVPLGGGVAGTSNAPVVVSAALSALSPDTRYRVRITASSHCSAADPGKVCVTESEPRKFRTFATAASALPDSRAWEMVSPAQKEGGQVFPADPTIGSCAPCKPSGQKGYPRQSAASGNAVAYEGSPFSAESGPVALDEYVSRRDPESGWHTIQLAPSLLGGDGRGFEALTSELGAGVFEQGFAPALSASAPGGFPDLYLQPTGNPSEITPLLTSTPPNRSNIAHEANHFALNFAGASADFSRVFFEVNDALTGVTSVAPAAVDGGPTVNNLYEWHAGQLSLVNVLPGNASTDPGDAFAPGNAHAISVDGTQAFFSSASGQVYVRQNGQSTMEIATEGVPDPGHFVAAAADGSVVLLENGHLHYLSGEERTVDLTQGLGDFVGLVGAGEDLSRLYFVDEAVLDSTPSAAGESAEPGMDNLYAWSQEAGTRFVAQLLPGDSEDWSRAAAKRTAQSSPSGRYVAFLSQGSLTGYDNTGPCEEISGTGEYRQSPCTEVFVYDSGSGTLSCASCDRSEVAPLGPSTLRTIHFASPGEPLPQYLSDEGRLFFDSQDSLVPADTNAGVDDVYEYEPPAVGSCEGSEACVSMISAGTGVSDSDFLAADPSGTNVFFTTRDRLTSRDKDELFDVYDARVGGGIPGEAEVAPAECQGAACQAVAPSPIEAAPGSASFTGTESGPRSNRRRCGRQKVRRRGKCVRKHAARAERPGAGHGGRGQKNHPNREAGKRQHGGSK
jgi:hypothetical protein